MKIKRKNVCVVVLGDIGRSPRMQNHALSLAAIGHVVDIIGYGETEPIDEIKKAPMVYYHYLLQCPQLPIKILNYIFKTMWQTFFLASMFLFIRRPDYILVQNPPAIPTLFVCWFFSVIFRSKLIIDWHNYAYTIMALNVGKNNKLVEITRKVESFFGRRAHYNFCVTKAMKNDLKTQWAISSIVLYDKPPDRFHSISLKEKHEFLLRFGQTYKEIEYDHNSTVFTEIVNDVVHLRKNRPGLIVSSTSWTEDEDFAVLFSALQEYENHHTAGNIRQLPDLICIITGKGHLKHYYCKKISEQKWKHVIVITPWLEPEDYPLVLASADLGVCLHTSSSGLDLPMKVVDMFGCGLPVCAYNFKSLSELVENGENGYSFNSSEELSQQLMNWFEHFPDNEKHQEIERKFKNTLKSFQDFRWNENWNNAAAPVFK